jgi:hypothetical protein
MDALDFQNWLYKVPEDKLYVENIFVIDPNEDKSNVNKIVFEIHNKFWIITANQTENELRFDLSTDIYNLFPELQTTKFFDQFVRYSIWLFSLLDNEQGKTVGIKIPLWDNSINEEHRKKAKLNIYAYKGKLHYEYRDEGLDTLIL